MYVRTFHLQDGVVVYFLTLYVYQVALTTKLDRDPRFDPAFAATRFTIHIILRENCLIRASIYYAMSPRIPRRDQVESLSPVGIVDLFV